jgi:hypothetical protein
MPRRCAAVVLSVLLASFVLTGPSQAAQPDRVAPSNGKWAGLSEVTSCDTVTSSEITESSGPDDLECALPVTGTTEAVDFRIASRRITSLAFDVVIQCHASDADHWTATTMRFTSSSGWGYTVLGGARTTAIPASGLLRMQFPVEETFGYPAGTVRATFDFRGQGAKVALFYEGTYSEPGFSNRCVSQSNTPSVIPVRKRV